MVLLRCWHSERGQDRRNQVDVMAVFGCDTAAVRNDEHRFDFVLLAQEKTSSCVE